MYILLGLPLYRMKIKSVEKKMPASPFAWRCLDSSFPNCHWVSHSRELIKRELKSPVFKNSHNKQNAIIKKVREWSGCDKILYFFGCLLDQIVENYEYVDKAMGFGLLALPSLICTIIFTQPDIRINQKMSHITPSSWFQQAPLLQSESLEIKRN